MRSPRSSALLGLALSAASGARAAGELTGTYAGSLSCRLQGASITSSPMRWSGSRSARPLAGRLRTWSSTSTASRYARPRGRRRRRVRPLREHQPAYGDPASGFEAGVRTQVDAATGGTTLHLASRSEFGLCEATWTRIDASEPGTRRLRRVIG